MAEIIQFPQRGEKRTVHFDEKHPFGEIGGLRLSLVQERGTDGKPFILVLLGGAEGFQPLETFDPTGEGMELAKVVADITLRALAAAHDAWAGQPIL